MLKRQSKYFAAISFLLALPLTASPEVKGNHLGPLDMFNVRYALAPQISPDGATVVYLQRFSDIMTDKTYSNLWAINFDGSNNRPLTTGDYQDGSPVWSPDGTRLAYISDRDGKPQIYVRWMDTGQTAKITNLEFGPSGLAWSPDSKSLAFVAPLPLAPPKLGTLAAAPLAAKWAPPARVINELVYRFNGIGYLPSASNQLFVISADGGTPHQITTGAHPLGGIGFRGIQPVWTPDGAYIIISANRRPDYEYEPFDSEVYQFAVADGALKPLTDRRGPDDDPIVSPDGKYIAYTGFDDRYQGYQVTHLYVMNRDGAASHELSAGFDRDVQNPVWAPDSRGIYFTYDDEGDTKLGFLALDASLNGKVTKMAEHLGSGGSSYSSAAGQPFSMANNGNFAIAYTTPGIPGDIAVATVGHPTTKVITSVNEGLLAYKTLGVVEAISYKSSKDGRRIQGWIIKPPDFDPSKKYPLILEIHGGPFANYGDRFDIEKQMMAAAGYVVLYTNPRGSTSYGAEFGNLIHHAYPGDDFNDLESGVDDVIARGYVDPDNLFVTGGSGGGVLTCWVVDNTTRFRAAVSLYPVINWYSWTLTSDIPMIGAKYWFPGNPADHTDQYMARSVISYVDRVKTPTMLMVGEEDYRCPPTEAEQFYAALKLNHVETMLILVPGEPHGISRIPSHHMAKVQYILNWFDQHRKGSPVAEK
ncbi:MAG TPA: S9 family peptidase [Blastocatellia bacterium]|nr:S9 family peptidase [Blastocatellia bacterium]